MNNYKLCKLVQLCILSCLCGACSSITFEQYHQENNTHEARKWHHTILNGVVEVSPPLNLKEICKDTTWNKVTTVYTPTNWLVATLNPFKIPFLIPYTPWTNSVQCYQTSAKQSIKGILTPEVP